MLASSREAMNTNFQVIGLTRLGINPSLQLKRQTLYTTRPSELLVSIMRALGD